MGVVIYLQYTKSRHSRVLRLYRLVPGTCMLGRVARHVIGELTFWSPPCDRAKGKAANPCLKQDVFGGKRSPSRIYSAVRVDALSTVPHSLVGSMF